MIAVVGDALLDRDVIGEVVRLTPEGPAPVLDEREIRTRPGGAALASVLLARDGEQVSLVTAFGGDPAGQELAGLLDRAGVRVIDLGLDAPTPEKIRLRADGVSIARWDRGEPTDARHIGPWTVEADEALLAADAVLVSCYGRGMSASHQVRRAVAATVERVPVVWDPHPRGTPPVEGAAVVTPNDAEARDLTSGIEGIDGDDLAATTARADRLVARWQAAGVAITRGSRGALFSRGSGLPAVIPAPAATGGDVCGAGDRFAATVVAELAAGHVAADAIATAVGAASRFVAAGGAVAVAAGPAGAVGLAAAVEPATRDLPGDATRHATEDAEQLVERIRSSGGTVVATGGCFDLVHAGHIHLLEAARALGDGLVVCVNSDDSVRRLKGPGRPIVSVADRVELLRALTCVDAVVVFDEDTPVPTLRRLRPDVFAKGGDYGNATIPEAEVLGTWGGQAVTLPYLDDRSTTRLLQEVRTRGTHH